MSWVFGNVTFPKPPSKVAFKSALTSRKIPLFTEAPWIMSQGPDAKQLSLEGEFFEGTDNLDTIFTNYCDPIERYASTPMIIDQPMMGDAYGSGTWHGESVSLFKNTGSDYIKNEESIQVRFNAGGLIYRDFDADRSLLNYNLVSIWNKGDNARDFKVTFYQEVEGSKANGYRYYLTTATAWAQSFVSISSGDFTTSIDGTVGSPTGWDKIRSIVIEPSDGAGNTNDYWFDAMYIGQGWKLNAPGSRYDGIYTITDWTVEEEGGNIRSLKVKLTLTDKSPLFGEV
jgi:hypothetical protein